MPWRGSLFLTAVNDDLASRAIAFDVAESVNSFEILLHAPFDALDADDELILGILATKETEHVAEQRTIRIGARRILMKVEAAERFFLHRALESHRLFFVQLGEEDFVFAARSQFSQERLLRYAEVGCGETGERPRLLDVRAVDDDFAHRDISRKDFPVTVQDHSAMRWDGRAGSNAFARRAWVYSSCLITCSSMRRAENPVKMIPTTPLAIMARRHAFHLTDETSRSPLCAFRRPCQRLQVVQSERCSDLESAAGRSDLD